MTELTKTDLGWILEIVLLNYEGISLTKFIGSAGPDHIILGKKVLEFIKKEW